MNNSDSNSPITFDQLSTAGKAKLLDMAFMPFVFGISSIPVCALALTIWAYELSKSITGLLVWGGIYIIAAIGIRLLNQQYKLERLKTEHEQLVIKWVPIICYVALGHAFGLTLLLFLIIGRFPFEFMLLYYVIVAAVLATYATHLTPLLKAFQWLFYPCWGAFMLLSPWTFPAHWHFMLLLMLVFAGSIHKHSLTGHQFFLKQILLEENETRLAESYLSAKEQAESALKAKNQFLTTASHDLRQPVHAMGFLVESISRRNRDSSLNQALNDLKQSVRSISQMFNSLLDLSKIESGVVQLRTGTIFLDELIRDVATVYMEEATARGLELRTRTSSGRAVVKADGMLLRQSLMNLVHNALRYTKHGGVLIACRRRGSDWQLEVWDTGVGVAIEEQNKIFSPFFRNEYAWRIDSAGHGLGLAVVARCCNLIGSQYGLTSKLSRGSRFWLRVPAITDHVQAIRIINVTGNTPFPSMNESLSGNCLIVDDDPQVTSAWELLLNTWGLQARCASSAVEAFAWIDSGFQPQAILCDQRLRAGESGFDVLRALLERCPDAHGAMISGEFNSPELIEAEQEGYLVLHKPLEPETLHALLSRWLPIKNQ